MSNFTKPVDYGFKVELEILLNQIRNNQMNIDFNKLKDNQANPKIKELYNKLSNNQNHIHYNQFGSKTGRLTTTDKSFPILTLNKNNRDIILPNNDFFLELDYNAAEVRVFLALNGFKQPGIDIHMWNKDKFGFPDRNTAKNNFISWLYGKKNPREKDFKKIYNTDKIKNKYWDGNFLEGNLLAWSEQGIGDIILFGSMVSELKDFAKQIIFETDKRLVNLFNRYFLYNRNRC